MELSDRDLKNEIRCTVEFYHRSNKSDLETVEMIKKAYKEDRLKDNAMVQNVQRRSRIN